MAEFNYSGIFGFDISRWQDDPTTPLTVDFNKMKNYGASFCISKAGQYNFSDRDFSRNWKLSKEAGLARGSYWFCDSRSKGKAQAQLYWKILQESGYQNEMCFADYEGGAWTDWNELYNFIMEFQSLSGLPDYKIGIYTGYYFFVENVKDTNAQKFFSSYPLWQAWYGTEVQYVKIPKGWENSGMLIWQSGTPAIGREVGVESREIDYNEFNGGYEKFKKYFGEIPNVEPPNGENQIPLNKKNIQVKYGLKSVSYSEI